MILTMLHWIRFYLHMIKFYWRRPTVIYKEDSSHLVVQLMNTTLKRQQVKRKSCLPKNWNLLKQNIILYNKSIDLISDFTCFG